MKAIGPLFPYFGAKWRSAKHYPVPQHNRIVELFAGGGGYSLNHYEREVDLYDASPHVAAAWKFLLDASVQPHRILDLVSPVRSVAEVPVEAQALVGFWLIPGSAVPKRTASSRANPDSLVYFAGSVWSPKTRARLATQVTKVCHWTFLQRDWREASASLLDAAPCTVFVDPPYQVKGVYYAGSRWSSEDYRALADRCTALKAVGHQVIVCERQGADWLPFAPLHTYHGSLADGVEVIWQ